MLPRTLTILIGAPVILLCTYVGGWMFYLLVLLLAMLSLNEFYSLMNLKGYHPSYLLGIISTFTFITFAQFTLKHPNWETVAAAVLTFAVIITFSGGIFQKKSDLGGGYFHHHFRTDLRRVVFQLFNFYPLLYFARQFFLFYDRGHLGQ